MSPHHIEIIRDWLKTLGVLVAASMSADEAQVRLAALTPMLLEAFPPFLFDQQSLRFVAEKCRFFPSYAELAEHLNAWWRHHPPPDNALPDETQQDEQTAQLVAAYWRLKPERQRKGTLAIGISWLQKYRGAFEAITRDDPDAYRLAKARGFIRDKETTP